MNTNVNFFNGKVRILRLKIFIHIQTSISLSKIFYIVSTISYTVINYFVKRQFHSFYEMEMPFSFTWNIQIVYAKKIKNIFRPD